MITEMKAESDSAKSYNEVKFLVLAHSQDSFLLPIVPKYVVIGRK